VTEADVSGESVNVNINMPMSELRSLLSKYPVTTRLNLSGTLVVARDQAHAKILERVESGKGKGDMFCLVYVTSVSYRIILGLPQYLKDHMVYYAGPAKTPKV
jgi:fumarate hydratase class I